MPQKLSAKTRTWGTRFDHLPSSPPPSPPLRDVAIAKENPPTGAKQHAPDASSKKEDKMPHDASVFVGSLPSNIEQQELTLMLSEHLAEHAEVKNIKVVRDSKGGVCAFVQCEDASSAARLIYTLHSTDPKPFLGRLLRYERARAFRTLLISYRTPMQFIQPDVTGSNATASDVEKEAKNMELILPSTMRLWRPWNAKYMTILYNTEARDSYSQNGEVPASSPGLFLHPLKFDAETIRQLALQFGPLLKFELLDAKYPAPHNGPRTAAMDNRCWEIKWDHRDDCVNALMTLRRVPHLTVTWAHQPNSSGLDHHHTTRFSHQNAAPYPYHVHEPAHQREAGGSQTSSTSGLVAVTTSTSFIPTVPHDEGWKIMQSQGSGILSNSVGDSPKRSPFLPSREGTDERQKSADWSVVDFPPLGDSNGERKAESGVWGDRKILTAETKDTDRSPSGSSLKSLVTTPRVISAQLFDPGDIEETTSLPEELDMPPTPELGRSPLTPRTPGSLFPDTPTSYLSNFQHSFTGFHQTDGKENMRYSSSAAAGGRELDPTTLFVGGLEVHGSNAWDQEKVRTFFARFGGLEQVTFVRPISSRSGFAFVKFNNTESPARAVYEEHNRVYEGRQMRIQLRDCNPPHRGTWSYGRGHGKYQHYGAQRHSAESEVADDSHEISYPDLFPKSLPRDERREVGMEAHQGENVTASDGINTSAPEFPTLDKAVTTERSELSALFGNGALDGPKTEVRLQARSSGSHGSENQQSSPDKPSTTEDTLSQPEYREWYEEPSSAAITPPPSSSASATAPGTAPFVSYPMANPGYYPPQNWMPPLAQHFPYPMPFMSGFHGFVPPANPAPQSFSSTTGSESSGPAAGTQNTWGGVYTPYMPYPGYPMRAPSIDHSRSQPPLQHGQPPLLPTGFIQGDQGSLIAVYHPEALDQYMSTAQPSSTPPGTQAQPAPAPAWNPFPQASAYPFQVPAPYMMPQPFLPTQGQHRPGANIGWMPGPAPLGYTGPQHQPPQAPLASSSRPMPNFRGGYSEGQPHTLPKRQHRRDQPHNYSSSRNHHARSLPNRLPRGGGQGAPQQPHAPPQFNPNAGDWSQWAAAGR